MEINLGDLGISPAMLARIQAGGGIMGKPKPKGKKKAVAKKAKPGVKLRRGKPVAARSPTPKLNQMQKLKDLFGDEVPIKTSQFPTGPDRFPHTGRKGVNPLAGINLEELMSEMGGEGGGFGSGTSNQMPGSKRLQDILDIKRAPLPPTPEQPFITIENPEAGASRGRPYKGNPFDGGADPIPPQFLTSSGSGGIAKAQPVVPPSNALSGPGITGVEADKRAKAYAEANNIKMDGRTPIFTSEAQRDAMYAAGFRGTGRIKLSEEDMASRRAESLANETPSDKAFRESREAVLKEREENPVPTGTLNPDQYRLLKNENLMDDDDDFFEDVEGQFGEAGTVYSKGFSESVVDDVSAERAQLKRDAIAANLDLGIDEPVGNVRDPNVAPINELFPDAPQAPRPPQLPEVRETYIPRNILGPSYDPKDREAYAARVQAQRDQMQPGGNIQSGGYPTATNPFSAVPQTQFGGYGAQMPMQALNPYAGMARRNPAKTNFFPDYIQRPAPVYENLPATGMAPPPKIT